MRKVYVLLVFTTLVSVVQIVHSLWMLFSLSSSVQYPASHYGGPKLIPSKILVTPKERAGNSSVYDLRVDAGQKGRFSVGAAASSHGAEGSGLIASQRPGISLKKSDDFATFDALRTIDWTAAAHTSLDATGCTEGSGVERECGQVRSEREARSCPNLRRAGFQQPSSSGLAMATKTHLLLLGAFLTNKPDPQRSDKKHSSSPFQYIRNWYESVVALNLYATVLHDGLPEEFIRNYTTSRITFVKVPANATPLSPTDERFVLYLLYLLRNPHAFVLMTDLSDVVLGKDPTELFVRDRRSFDLWVGSEEYRGVVLKVQESKWLRDSYRKCYGKAARDWDDGVMYNNGVVGGGYDHVIGLLEEVACELVSMQRARGVGAVNCDMTAFNHVLLRFHRNERIFTGAPFHNEYKRPSGRGYGQGRRCRQTHLPEHCHFYVFHK